MADFRYVDLGTKHGGALDVARKRGPQNGLPRAHPHQCLGVDRNPDHEAEVCKRGYKWSRVKLHDPDWIWPKADCYLAWNFLEHLDSIETAQEVLRWMIRQSRQCVWLLMPSFEPDARARLNERGFELPWYDDKWHKAHVTKRHVLRVVAELPKRVRRVVWRPKWPISNLVIKDLITIPNVTPKPGQIKPHIDGAWECFLWTR